MDSTKTPFGKFTCDTPEETFQIGETIGASLLGGEVILLSGTLGAGKTLLTKGIVDSLGFDVDEVTSPSFTLVNLYQADFDIYHIDLWRVGESGDAAFAVGLDEILENEKVVVIIEWAEFLKEYEVGREAIHIDIVGDGDEARQITIGKNSGFA